MSRLWARFSGIFTNRTFIGIDKSGNRYFTRTEEIDGIMKEKRCVVFKGDQDPTSVPVEWICWLNGQRKRAPTPEILEKAGPEYFTFIYITQARQNFLLEMAQLEARRERVRLNVAFLKKEEEERKAREGKDPKIGKSAGPDLKSFIQQFPTDSEGNKIEELSDTKDATSDKGSEVSGVKKQVPEFIREEAESSEPTGSGESFRPGTWQPPM